MKSARADRFKRDVPALGESPASCARLRAGFVCARDLCARTTFRATRDPTPSRPGVVQGAATNCSRSAVVRANEMSNDG
eukprot:scaffold10350_cov68-Phaeocystis_antarctica.AAC.3